jgi:tripartite-type tricarboxylate transporter receptor subunit TctC
LLGGQVDMVFSAYPSLAGFVKVGQVRLLATNAGQRSTLAPEVPAIAEKIAGFDFAPNIILLARAGTPLDAIARIDQEVARIAKRADAADAARTAGFVLVGGSAAELERALKAEIERMARVAKVAGLQPE